MSNDTFKNNPDLKEYFETSDGQKFYKEDLAKNHARSLDDKGVTHVFRDQTIEADRETAKEILAKVPEMDLETAQDYLDTEITDSPRKSVVAALEKRIAELEGDEDPNQNTKD